MKSSILLLSQSRNELFRCVSLLFVFILLLPAANHLTAQTENTGSIAIIPDSIHNEVSMSPVVVINHSMIERFLTVSFPSEKMGLSNLIRNYSLDSIKTILESEMKRNVAQVPSSETKSGSVPSLKDKENTHSKSGMASLSN